MVLNCERWQEKYHQRETWQTLTISVVLVRTVLLPGSTCPLPRGLRKDTNSEVINEQGRFLNKILTLQRSVENIGGKECTSISNTTDLETNNDGIEWGRFIEYDSEWCGREAV